MTPDSPDARSSSTPTAAWGASAAAASPARTRRRWTASGAYAARYVAKHVVASGAATNVRGRSRLRDRDVAPRSRSCSRRSGRSRSTPDKLATLVERLLRPASRRDHPRPRSAPSDLPADRRLRALRADREELHVGALARLDEFKAGVELSSAVARSVGTTRMARADILSRRHRFARSARSTVRSTTRSRSGCSGASSSARWSASSCTAATCARSSPSCSTSPPCRRPGRCRRSCRRSRSSHRGDDRSRALDGAALRRRRSGSSSTTRSRAGSRHPHHRRRRAYRACRRRHGSPGRFVAARRRVVTPTPTDGGRPDRASRGEAAARGEADARHLSARGRGGTDRASDPRQRRAARRRASHRARSRMGRSSRRSRRRGRRRTLGVVRPDARTSASSSWRRRTIGRSSPNVRPGCMRSSSRGSARASPELRSSRRQPAPPLELAAVDVRWMRRRNGGRCVRRPHVRARAR